ncbi:hypothetical protein [Limimaricola hongkongensis]|uniref:Uncharacterized protein n=1 Tax=Limimaricola hongkongensis DSM 17492 TaxID=1122180 RepID=A0A017HEI1_9RHOB|nr:hypothetical protein [Limimaricola hongkongensis]EYD72776.1 hypothetical protein Lokhon_01581 [Limimaricola hongkongensis DSM 17492]
MNSDTIVARRALIRAYRAYLDAEDDLAQALDHAAAVLPELRQHGLRPIGAPGSRIRRLTELRSHSVEVLDVMRDKHRRAVMRIAARSRATQSSEPPKALR